ncbi:PTI1-like tyrosine-protein kinase [Camellia lanceoleosa]|uniref:PTI1-like tyrosine-protein kinase n=1 Tax=Camellia lanceoleosa TaxID=1840588 RepID=A0ACC0F397_9ERIC|nr:PTI1-like tyrosine-protein kinase [Camellia lanceoleosa]
MTEGWAGALTRRAHRKTIVFANTLGKMRTGIRRRYWDQVVLIAVKRLKVWSNKAEMEFAVQVEILARVRHKN